jgi:uncharacterized protein (DUF1697 family)
MQRYIAFLRAINVGGRTVKMGHLRELFIELGLASVETFISSGNVIFESAETDAASLEARIEDRLKESLGFEVATFLRTPDELVRIAAFDPLPEMERTAFSVAFLRSAPDADAVPRLMALRSEIDEFHVEGREVFWLCRTRVSESTFSGAALERALAMPTTVRNRNTVQRLAAKYG